MKRKPPRAGRKAAGVHKTAPAVQRKPPRAHRSTRSAQAATGTPVERLAKTRPQWLDFLRHYRVDWNGAAAARRAGFAESAAKTTACRILSDPLAQDALQQLGEEAGRRIDVSADRVTQALARLAFLDPRRMYAADGTLLPVPDMPEDVAMGLSAFKVRERTEHTGTGKAKRKAATIATRDVKLVDRKGCLELLGRSVGAWKGTLGDLEPPPTPNAPQPGATPDNPLNVRMVIERRIVHVATDPETGSE